MAMVAGMIEKIKTIPHEWQCVAIVDGCGRASRGRETRLKFHSRVRFKARLDLKAKSQTLPHSINFKNIGPSLGEKESKKNKHTFPSALGVIRGPGDKMSTSIDVASSTPLLHNLLVFITFHLEVGIVFRKFHHHTSSEIFVLAWLWEGNPSVVFSL